METLGISYELGLYKKLYIAVILRIFITRNDFENFRWYRKDQNECYWWCQGYRDDWSHSLEKYFPGNGQNQVIFHKNRALKVSGHKITAIEKWSSYFCVRPLLNFSNVARFLGEINRFWLFLQKIYLYTSASAFSEILQRLKQNSKTSCDLGKLPTEVGVKILKCLDATGKLRV